MIPNINFKIIFALVFWLLILNFRLFRNYRDISFSAEAFKEEKYLFANLFFITLGITIMTLVSLYLHKKTTLSPSVDAVNKPNKFVLFLHEEFHWVFSLLTKLDEGKKDLYGKIFDLLPSNYFLVDFTYNFIKHNKKLRLLLFAGIILPRVIIICILITEIYQGHLHYYYYSLILLIIPLGVQLIVFMLNDIGSRLSYIISEYLDIENVPANTKEFVKHKNFIKSLEDIPVPAKNSKATLYYISLKKEYEYCDLNLFMEHFYYPITGISGFMKFNFLPLYTIIRLFTLFFFFFVQALCWGYIFFFLF